MEQSNHSLDQTAQADSLRDHLLVAMPGLNDPDFSHSVTYVCEHSAEGAMGLVLTNPMDLHLAEVFAQMELTDRGEAGAHQLLTGGPVQRERGFVLHSADSRWQSTLDVSEQVRLTASRDIIAALAEGTGPADYVMALGYAGWDAGQLEAEVAANAWLTLPAERHILFDTPAEQRWSAAARALGVDLNLISSTAGHA